ncbi:MAG: ABC transporter permease subunit, partial [Chloroflexi bacterium]|nr:ABC transporter permease subunit [Chloroflexota bacterium]
MIFTVLAVTLGISIVVVVTRNLARQIRAVTVPVTAPALSAAALAWWATSDLGVFASDILAHMVLPVGVLTLISFGGWMLLTRSSMLEVIGEDFVLAARAKGLPSRVVRDRHVAHNAM